MRKLGCAKWSTNYPKAVQYQFKSDHNSCSRPLTWRFNCKNVPWLLDVMRSVWNAVLCLYQRPRRREILIEAAICVYTASKWGFSLSRSLVQALNSVWILIPDIKEHTIYILHTTQMGQEGYALLVVRCILFYGSSIAVMVMFNAHKPCAINMCNAVFNSLQCCAKLIYLLGPA